jgi:apolipoprotein N-acyltransferase
MPVTVALALPFALCLGVVVWGWARMAQPLSGTPVRVGLAASDATIRYFRTEHADEALRVIAAYAERAATLAARGAEVVVLPEKFVGVTPAYAADARALLAQAASRHRVRIIAGFNQIETPAPRNIAVVLGTNGEIEAEYQKRLLVPGWEDAYRAGDHPTLLTSSHGTWGVAICRDLLYPELGREYARAGAGLMLIPAWDFVADQYIQALNTRVRAIEGGFAIARAAQEGVVLLTDRFGRVVAAGSTTDQPEVLLVGDVVPGLGRTFYSRTGDWFVLLNLVAAALIAIGLVVRRARGGAHTDDRGARND